MSENTITWIDVEATGLDPNQEQLLEVACLITDLDLNLLDETGYEAVVYYPAEVSKLMEMNAVPLVQEMHRKTGLWKKLPSGKLLSVIDNELVSYQMEYCNPQESWLGGNSITLDRSFLKMFTPRSFNYLHYRSLDVTSLAGPARWWYNQQFQKRTAHSAMSDIRESIDEARFIREKAFR